MNRKTIIVGAGGHARVIAGLLATIPNVEVIGVADRTDRYFGEMIMDHSIMTTFANLPAWRGKGITDVALALGDNHERADMYLLMKEMGFHVLSLIHPSAVIDAGVHLGEGVVVCAGAILCAQVSVGENSLINSGAIIDHECTIGAHVHIGPGCRIAGRVKIGERAFIGVGTSVKDKITIGARSVIGAGSVVVNPIPDAAVAYGVPAVVQQ